MSTAKQAQADTRPAEMSRLGKTSRRPQPGLAAVSGQSELFLAEVGHELKTGLMSVLGYSEMLLQAPANSPPERGVLEAIHANSRHLIDVLESMLESGCSGSAPKPAPVACRVREITSELLRSFGTQASSKGLTLQCHSSTETPEQILMDETALRRILSNLLSNSIKYSSHGTVLLSVSVEISRTCESDRTVVFEVADEGPGIEPEELERIGTPFFRGSAVLKSQASGTGLGLFITNRLVKALGGCLSVTSSVAQGTRVSVRCPLAVPAKSLNRAAAQHDPAGSRDAAQAALSRHTGRILLIENDPDAQRLVKSFLGRQGLKVHVANDGSHALSLIDPGYDLVLIDFHLPGLDGLSTARLLRQRGYRGAMVGLSAAQAPSRHTLAKAGIDAFLDKTTSLDRLLARCREYLPRCAMPTQAIAPAVQESKLAQLQSNYAQRLQKSVKELRKACNAGDRQSAAAISHRIMGTSGLYGFESVASAAKTVNESLRAKQTGPEIKALVNRLSNQARRVARCS